MGITLSGLERVSAPVQALLGWLTRASAVRGRTPASVPGSVRLAAPRSYPRRCPAPVKSCGVMTRRPLRVVRIVEACPPPAGAGRMIISGRMADVCAELERLAALEAAAG